MSLLEVESLEAGYGEVRVLHDVSFSVEEGQIATILGPNGAGKTTTLRAVSGAVRPSTGEVRFDGQSIVGSSPERVARLGIAHVPEGRGTFAGLNVEENLRVGAYRRRDDGIREDMDRCFQYFPRLEERRRERAGNLSGGEQQMLAVARGLMLGPRLLLLDEPSLGLAPVLTRELFNNLATIASEEKVTVLLVEQNANLALRVADYAYVLEAGRIALSGEAEQMQEEKAIRESYLGV